MRKLITLILLLSFAVTVNSQPKDKPRAAKSKASEKASPTGKAHASPKSPALGTGEVDKSMKGPNGEAVYTGPKGGKYYMDKNGKKKYIPKKKK